MTVTPVSSETPVISAKGLTKVYGAGELAVAAVSDVDLSVAPGSLAVLTGRSGSGKTTLLNLLGGLEEPTSGEVRLADRLISEMSDDEKALARRHHIGFIFQAFGLLPMLTAAENVEVPLRMVKTDVKTREARSRTLLELVGLSGRANHRPSELSGGEQQRVAIARALANRPKLLLADEPTGQLDSRTGADIVEIIVALVRSEGIAALIATHDTAPLAYANDVFVLSDGRIDTPH